MKGTFPIGSTPPPKGSINLAIIGGFLGVWVSLFFWGGWERLVILAVIGFVVGLLFSGFQSRSSSPHISDSATFHNTVAGDRRPFLRDQPYAPPQKPLALGRSGSWKAPSSAPPASFQEEAPLYTEIPLGREISFPTSAPPEGPLEQEQQPQQKQEQQQEQKEEEGDATIAQERSGSVTSEDRSFASQSTEGHTLGNEGEPAHTMGLAGQRGDDLHKTLFQTSFGSASLDAGPISIPSTLPTQKSKAFSPTVERRIAQLLEAAKQEIEIPLPKVESARLPEVERWIKDLASLHLSTREAAIEELRQRGPSVLFEMIPDLDNFLIREGFESLVTALGSPARLHLERLLAYGSDAQQEWLLGLVAAVYKDDAKPALIRALRSPHMLLQYRARQELEAMGHSASEIEALQLRS